MGELKIHWDRQLGGGSLRGATVYQGSFQDIDVAVKSVPHACLLDSDESRRLEGLLQPLHHDNLVKIYRMERNEHFRFYVLELCSSTLQHCFLADENVNKYRGPLPSQVEGSLQMVSGLEYLHSQNIVHGNIKPENVLISSAQPVLLKLGDFSRLRESLSVWTAPEILTETTDDVRQLGASVAQRRATAQSDTWSLGCVLFFFLQQGRHPFGDKNIIKNASEGNPNLLRELLDKSTDYKWKLLLVGQMIERDAESRLPLPELKNCLQLVLCYMNRSENAGGTPGRSPRALHFAAALESSIAPALTAEILTRGTVDANTKDEPGRTALTVVAAKKTEEISGRQRCQTMPAALTRSMSSPLEIIQQMLDNGRDVNERDRSGRTPLHYAVCIVHQSAPAIVRFLVEKGASVGIKDELGRTPLHSAALVESDYALEIVRILLEKKAYDNVNETDQLGWTPLHFAVRNERESAPAMVRFLIQKGAMVEIRDASGKNPLHGAIEKQSNHTLAIVQLLLGQATADGIVTAKETSRSCSPLLVANYVLVMLQILLKKEPVATVNARDRYGRTPLHYAVCIVHPSAPQIVGCLIEKGATGNIRDGGGRTALHAVMKNESPHALEMARMLLSGDNTNEKDNFGSTPLHLAVRNRHESAADIVALLVEKGAQVSIQDKYGRTPLLLSTTNESDSAVDMVRFLLDKGASVDEKDMMDRTPLHWVTGNRTKPLDIIRLLLLKGGDANINSKDKNGSTPIQCAEKNQTLFTPDVLHLLQSVANKSNQIQQHPENI